MVLGAGVALLILAGCERPSAVARKDDVAAPAARDGEAAAPREARAQAGQADHRDDPVQLVDGKPMWSASRKYSAEENAQRSFERNGKDFDARDVDAFVRKAHAFVAHPPTGALTLTRANGDTLIYDPKGNVFAVANKAGAPRTLFKPDDGMDYWQEQKTREARRQQASADRKGRDDEAG
jgi:pyocin large subunit-like protein